MVFIYLSKFDREAKVVWLACPACSTKIEGLMDDFITHNWVVACPRCGAVFGHVPYVRFRTYVSKKWKQARPIAKGVVDPQPVYADFLIVDREDGMTEVRRWHGWVDPETREIVQEG